MKKYDLTGRQFDRLRVTGEVTETSVMCRCACGKETVVQRRDLLSGNTRSCGCLRLELSTARVTTHQGSYTTEYRTWRHIRDRCENPSNPRFKDYGARGITFYKPWRDNFPVFLAAVGKRPSPQHTLDRRNNSKGYVPGNVRWATPEQQARNTRRNKKLTLGGRTQTLAAWAEELGVNARKLQKRKARGWSDEATLLTP